MIPVKTTCETSKSPKYTLKKKPKLEEDKQKQKKGKSQQSGSLKQEYWQNKIVTSERLPHMLSCLINGVQLKYQNKQVLAKTWIE